MALECPKRPDRASVELRYISGSLRKPPLMFGKQPEALVANPS